MIKLSNVCKQYDNQYAVRDVSLTIERGKLTVLLGPSGSGKTTILRMINRMIEPSSGEILVDGRDISRIKPELLRRSIGYVIQSTGLFPNMTVARNIGVLPRILGWTKDAITQRTDELLHLVGLDPRLYASKMPSELSGGEAQRVGVARALAADPPIILMDEPFGAVDPVTRRHLQAELRALQLKLGKTIVFVTHDIDEAFLLADQIVLMKQGQVAQQGSPGEFLSNPADEFVTEFLGEGTGLRIAHRFVLSDMVISPEKPEQDCVVLDETTTLASALLILIDTGARCIAVSRDDTAYGTVTLESVLAAIGEYSQRDAL